VVAVTVEEEFDNISVKFVSGKMVLALVRERGDRAIGMSTREIRGRLRGS
jgi:hypothetical protein